jgi:hypothetical protein
MGASMTQRLVRQPSRDRFARKPEARRRVEDKGAESAASLDALVAKHLETDSNTDARQAVSRLYLQVDFASGRRKLAQLDLQPPVVIGIKRRHLHSSGRLAALSK